jgi:hypothetical protein
MCNAEPVFSGTVYACSLQAAEDQVRGGGDWSTCTVTSGLCIPRQGLPVGPGSPGVDPVLPPSNGLAQ